MLRYILWSYIFSVKEEDVCNVTTMFFPLESCAVDTDNCKACKSGEQKCETCDNGYKPDANGVCQGIMFL